MKYGNKEFEAINIQVNKKILDKIRDEATKDGLTLSEWFHMRLTQKTTPKPVDYEEEDNSNHKIISQQREARELKKKQNFFSAIKKNIKSIEKVIHENNTNLISKFENVQSRLNALEEGHDIHDGEQLGDVIQSIKTMRPIEIWDRVHAIETRQGKFARLKEMVEDNQKQIDDNKNEFPKVKAVINEINSDVSNLHTLIQNLDASIKTMDEHSKTPPVCWYNPLSWFS